MVLPIRRGLALIVISAGMQKAASASYFNLTNGLLMAAGYEDVRTLRRRFGWGFFMSRVNCNVGPLRAYKLAWLSLPHWLGQSFVVKTHERPSVWARLWIRLGVVRPTYIYRDPRDVAVSLFEHGERLRRDRMDSHTKFDQLDTLDAAIRFTSTLLPIWQEWAGLPDMLAIRFEDYTPDLLLAAGRLNAYLRLKLDEAALRDVVRGMEPQGMDPKLASSAVHMHSGKAGRWQAKMTDAQKELCQEVFGPYLPQMGY